MCSHGEKHLKSYLIRNKNQFLLQYLKKRALRRLENEQGAHNSAMDNSGYQTEPKMMPKKISGIVTIPQHERVLQQQLAQIHHVTYAVYYNQVVFIRFLNNIFIAAAAI